MQSPCKPDTGHFERICRQSGFRPVGRRDGYPDATLLLARRDVRNPRTGAPEVHMLWCWRRGEYPDIAAQVTFPAFITVNGITRLTDADDMIRITVEAAEEFLRVNKEVGRYTR